MAAAFCPACWQKIKIEHKKEPLISKALFILLKKIFYFFRVKTSSTGILLETKSLIFSSVG